MLAKGQNVLVDRCNIDATQRADFIALARSMAIPVCTSTLILYGMCLEMTIAMLATNRLRSGTPYSYPKSKMQVHAVVLGLEAHVCAQRASQRVDHEGGVDGSGAKEIVLSMAGQMARAGAPSKSEGLQSIMVRHGSLTQA